MTLTWRLLIEGQADRAPYTMYYVYIMYMCIFNAENKYPNTHLLYPDDKNILKENNSILKEIFSNIDLLYTTNVDHLYLFCH